MGVAKIRSSYDILGKTQKHERSLKKASDFSSDTGEGIGDMYGEDDLVDLSKKRFKHYFF